MTAVLGRQDDGTFWAEVPPLRGVLATGRRLEACREELGEVVEEWVLVRLAQGLSVPTLRNVTVRGMRRPPVRGSARRTPRVDGSGGNLLDCA